MSDPNLLLDRNHSTELYRRGYHYRVCMSHVKFKNFPCCMFLLLKPIFHQNAKYLALGTFASANAKDITFALPDAKNTNMLVSLALGDAHFSRFTRRET